MQVEVEVQVEENKDEKRKLKVQNRFPVLRAKNVRKSATPCIIARSNFHLISTCEVIFESHNACCKDFANPTDILHVINAFK